MLYLHHMLFFLHHLKYLQLYPIVVGWRGHLEGDQLYLEHNNNPKHAVVSIAHPDHVIAID